jgi:hypothetical protein
MNLSVLQRMGNFLGSQRLLASQEGPCAVEGVSNVVGCWNTSQIRDFLVEYVLAWHVCTTDLLAGHVFSHENILVIGRVAETQVIQELTGARHSPEASLAVDRLDEVRSHLGVVTRQSSYNVKFTTQNT